ncbi:MAG: hypothetical protein JW809_10365 [Pirellulales bacterium]|nr:hypothetical protein [Pirellulales bacterium]
MAKSRRPEPDELETAHRLALVCAENLRWLADGIQFLRDGSGKDDPAVPPMVAQRVRNSLNRLVEVLPQVQSVSAAVRGRFLRAAPRAVVLGGQAGTSAHEAVFELTGDVLYLAQALLRRHVGDAAALRERLSGGALDRLRHDELVPVEAMLRREFELARGPAPVDASTPAWNREGRTLSFRGKVARKYPRDAPEQFTVLDAFQRAGWPADLPSPLAEFKGPKELRGMASALNRALTGMKFSFRTGPDRFHWERF